MQAGLKLSSDLFDYQEALSRVGDADLVKLQAWEFVSLHGEYATQLREAAQTGNTPALLRLARTLRHALVDLSGARCLRRLSALERAARAGSFAEAVVMADALENELSDLLQVLDSVVSPSMMN